jgi:hypothetical protein
MSVATWVLLDEWTQRREAKEACSALEQDEPGKLVASVVWVTQPFLKELNWES